MGRLADTVSNNMLNAMFGQTPYDPPDTLYIALSTTLPTNTGTNVTEPNVANGYARVAVPNDVTNFPNAVSRTKSNGLVISFPTATGSWGTITHFAIYDAPTGGNFIGWGALNTSTAITTGNAPSFPVGSLIISAPGT